MRPMSGRAAVAAATISVAALLGTVLHAKGLAGSQEASAAGQDREAAAGHLRRGTELARQEQHVEAVAEFRLALAASPQDSDAHFLLGRSLLAIAVKDNEPFDAAAAELTEALRLDPSR